MKLPNNPTEFYVGACFDLYTNEIFKQSAFYVYIREMVGATPRILHGLIDMESLKKLTIKYESVVSKNSIIENGELMLLDTVERISRNVPSDHVLDNSLIEYKEDYKGSVWWLLDSLNQMQGNVKLTDEYVTPIANMRFSKSTMTLFYSFKTPENTWSSKKVLWFTDTFHLTDDLKVIVPSNQLHKHIDGDEILSMSKNKEVIDYKGESCYELHLDLTDTSLITKTLKDISMFTIKEFTIKDVMQSELASIKMKGASHAKLILEDMMQVAPTDDFQEYTVNSGIKQTKNLIFETIVREPKRTVIEHMFKKEEYRNLIISALETGNDDVLDPVADKLIEDYGLTAYTRDYYMGFINSVRVNDEGLFDYHLHNHNVSMYRQESFNSNLNLHKERVQMFLHEYDFGMQASTVALIGGEYKNQVIVKKVGYDD